VWNAVSGPLLRKLLHLPTAAVSGHRGIYYAEKVAQYAQNLHVTVLTHDDLKTLRTKCIEITTLTFRGHVMSSVTRPFDTHYVVSYRRSVASILMLPLEMYHGRANLGKNGVKIWESVIGFDPEQTSTLF